MMSNEPVTQKAKKEEILLVSRAICKLYFHQFKGFKKKGDNSTGFQAEDAAISVSALFHLGNKCGKKKT